MNMNISNRPISSRHRHVPATTGAGGKKKNQQRDVLESYTFWYSKFLWRYKHSPPQNTITTTTNSLY